MLFYRKILVSTVAGIAFVQAASAADDIVPAETFYSGIIAGEIAGWGSVVTPTNTSINGNDCDSGATEYCATVFGVGGYAGAQYAFSPNWSVIVDGTIDYHEETNSNSANRDDPAIYGAVGAHLVTEYGPYDVGVFGTLIGHGNHAQPGGSSVAGFGAEVRRDNLFFQGGALFGLQNDDDELDNMFFVRGGGEYEVGPGVIEASAAYGWGDFEGPSGGGNNDDPSDWVQWAVQYEAPIPNTRVNWFAGYQGDFVRVDEGPNAIERTILHTFMLGVKIKLNDKRLPFKTPNFRAPVTNADEFN